jgi:Na+-transporting NADH:ubiquinone oxidoreductase subunit NqrB
MDTRLFQIAALGGLLALQMEWFDFGASSAQVAISILATLASQALLCSVFGMRFDWRSPLITGLSLALLLRTHDPLLWCAASGLAIGSKFLVRIHGKHIWNPACFAIVVLLLCSGRVWISPGQWGTAVWLEFLSVSLGGMVLSRAERLDIALAFLISYGCLLFVRCLFLGDPLTIPAHQMQSGTLLIFGLFMITDPRSTPNSRWARILFAVAVAGVAYWLQFDQQVHAGLAMLWLWSPSAPRFLTAGGRTTGSAGSQYRRFHCEVSCVFFCPGGYACIYAEQLGVLRLLRQYHR